MAGTSHVVLTSKYAAIAHRNGGTCIAAGTPIDTPRGPVGGEWYVFPDSWNQPVIAQGDGVVRLSLSDLTA
jgi:hypothetical protein